MHDEARAAAENGVKLVLAGDRKALIAARFEARETVAEIPAPRALATLPASVPTLRICGVATLSAASASTAYCRRITG